MHLTAGELDALKYGLPQIAGICTAVVAAIAIRANRATSTESLTLQAGAEHRQFFRDNQLITYLELLKAVDKVTEGDYVDDLWEVAADDLLYPRLQIFGAVGTKVTLEAWRDEANLTSGERNRDEVERLFILLVDRIREDLGTGPGHLSVSFADRSGSWWRRGIWRNGRTKWRRDTFDR